MLHVAQESEFALSIAQARQKINVLAQKLTPKKSATRWIPVHGGSASGLLATQHAVMAFTLDRSGVVQARVVIHLMLPAAHVLATAKAFAFGPLGPGNHAAMIAALA